MNVIFFGSTSDSVLVLEKLCHVSRVTCQAVVTQPAKPIGRKQLLTPTPVETWAKAHNMAVLSFPPSPSNPSLFADDQVVIDTLQPLKADLLISASFGQHIPFQIIKAARFGGLNVHPSLLPRWRGADPVPWAILSGDAQTGVSIVTLSEDFDSGKIIAQKKIPITDKDFSDPLRTRLFELGAELLVEALSSYLSSRSASWRSDDPHKTEIASSKTPRNDNTKYARRFTRDDGFEPWENILKALENAEEAKRIDRKFRSLTPWPGLWTTIATPARPATLVHSKTETKRLKILSLHLQPTTNNLQLDTVQLEGKKPVAFHQFQKAYLR